MIFFENILKRKFRKQNFFLWDLIIYLGSLHAGLLDLVGPALYAALNLVVSRSAAMAFGNRLVTGRGQAEWWSNTDTDRARCGRIYAVPTSTYDHAPPGSASILWEFVSHLWCGYLTDVDERGVSE